MSDETHDVVLITGCSSGIGRALAEAFLAAGCRVVATARRIETLSALRAAGARTAALDVTDAQASSELLAGLVSEGLAVDVLVNNAGYGAMGPLADMDQAAWRRQFEVNLFAPMALSRLVLPGMIARRRGRVVNIGSISGEVPTPFAGVYCASKAAFNAATEVLRMEVAPFGVRVVNVLAGGVSSSFGQTAGAGAALPRDSVYRPFAKAIAQRAQAGQSAAMPAEAFARTVVRQVLSGSPPPTIRLGAKSRLMPALRWWLPRPMLERLLARRFGLT